MEEFRNLPWPVSDVGSLEESYVMSMPECHRRNPTDVFFCNLMEIDPLHFDLKQHGMQESNENEEILPNQFVDPRTGIEISSHECNYRSIDLEKKNIFLNKYIQASVLQKHEHIASLNVIRNSKCTQTDQMIYEMCAVQRFEEKSLYLDKLREHFFEKLSKRFHDVPPSINYFITQNWKKHLILMHRRFISMKYRMKSAISFQSAKCTVKTNILHREQLGNVAEMRNLSTDYMRQSTSKLMTAYDRRKVRKLSSLIEDKTRALSQKYGIDFILPISILKLIVTGEQGAFCMKVRDSAQSNTFNPKKEITFDKPLPPTYLSGNERYKKGAKYLMHSCFNFHPSNVFDYTSQKEVKSDTVANRGTNQNDDEISGVNSNISLEYKIYKCDDFLVNFSKSECSYENTTLTVVDVQGRESLDDENETFRILVKSKQNGYKKNEHGAIEFVNYSPKIEFQAEYGSETMNRTELIREWCDSFFRPDTITERVRFDSTSGKIIQRQSLSIMDIENEMKTLYGIESQQLLSRIWYAQQTFNNFPVGDYLLQSDLKKVDFVRVYERTDGADDLGIDQILKDISFELNLFDEAQWQPIDDRIITEIHEKYQILPCAFPHVDYLKEHDVKPPKEESTRLNKHTKKVKQLLKIKPKDDSHQISLKLNKKQSKKNTFSSQKKQLKKSRYRAKKRALVEARLSEAKEFEATKDLFVATLDQYKTPCGKTLDSPTINSKGDTISSVATRTRTKSKCQSPTDNTIVRRSGRVAANKPKSKQGKM